MKTKRATRIQELPGHLFRRLHQLAVAQFTAEMKQGLTPIQWAALVTISQSPGLDQSSLSREVFIDTSTMAGVLDRLETRGLVRRQGSPDDRRLRLLFVTEEGESVLQHATAAVLVVQQWLMAPLSEKERAQFVDLMLKVLNRPE